MEAKQIPVSQWGLAGHNSGTISFDYAAGSTTAGVAAGGGFTGINNAVITSCYSTCHVTGEGNVSVVGDPETAAINRQTADSDPDFN